MVDDLAVLLVETHKPTVEVTASIFRIAFPRMRLHTAENATSAVRIAMEHKIDLLICAAGLGSHEEMLFAMQLCDRLLHIPIFLIADDGHTYQKLRSQSLFPPVKEVFLKPVDLDDLLLKVQNLIQQPVAA